MIATLSTYTQTEIENAARFALTLVVRELLSAAAVNNWTWGTHEIAFNAADMETLVYVRVEFDETGMSYGLDCPANLSAPVWFDNASAAMSSLAMLLG